MTRPRRHEPGTELITVAGRQVTPAQLHQLLCAYDDEHGHVRVGIRGHRPGTHLAAMPDDWAVPYFHLLDEPTP